MRSFLDADLIDRFVLYVAPRLMSGGDVVPMVAGPTATSIDLAWQGRFVGVCQLGEDLRIELVPASRCDHPSTTAFTGRGEE